MKYIVYRTLKFICKPLFWLIFHPTIKGKENIPQGESVILAGNHTGFMDAIFMLYAPKGIVHMMAKKELFDSKFKYWFFKSMGCISVDRTIHDKGAVSSAMKVLTEGGIVGIFPEGTVNKTTKVILPFKYGAVSMANKTNSYIVPFSITGKYSKRNITICYGLPYKVSNDLEHENDILERKVIQLIKENQK